MSKKILMVCLGNICRSPVADGMLRKKAAEAGIDVIVDSCGTGGWHAGESPDPRSQENARANGLDISSLRARQFRPEDLDEFDMIFCMDRSNVKDVLAQAENDAQRAKVRLLLDLTHPEQDKEVPDPYYGGDRGFQTVHDLIEEACEVLIEELR
ncbi:MAG: low molecular weight phosphotyrosine protein phosphatase [Flavobacteriales bacterium]|nr:low molecular weight phosphotyrosine protein phosphatase [Flavobacteriales bacterium]